MANADAYVLVLRPRGRRRTEFYVDRDANNQYMVRASPDIREAQLIHNRGIADGLKDDLRRCGFPDYEVMRVIELNGKPAALPGYGGGSG